MLIRNSSRRVFESTQKKIEHKDLANAQPPQPLLSNAHEVNKGDAAVRSKSLFSYLRTSRPNKPLEVFCGLEGLPRAAVMSNPNILAQSLAEPNFKIDQRTKEGQTPLHLAVLAGNVWSVTRLLLTQMQSPTMNDLTKLQNNDGYTPRDLSALTNTKSVSIVLDAATGMPAHTSVTPLVKALAAAETRRMPALQHVVQTTGGAIAVRALTPRQLIPVIKAGDTSALKILLANGLTRATLGKAVLAALRKAIPPLALLDPVYYESIGEIFRSIFKEHTFLDIEKMFLRWHKAGSPYSIPFVDTSVQGGASSVCNAAQAGDIVALRYLLERQPHLAYQPTATGWTPMHYAVAAGNLEVVQLLHAHNASVQVCTLAGVPAWAMARSPAVLAALQEFAVPLLSPRPEFTASTMTLPNADIAFSPPISPAASLLHVVQQRFGTQGAAIEESDQLAFLQELTGLDARTLRLTSHDEQILKTLGNTLALGGNFASGLRVGGHHSFYSHLQKCRVLLGILAGNMDLEPIDDAAAMRKVIAGQLIAELGALTNATFIHSSEIDLYKSKQNLANVFIARWASQRIEQMHKDDVIMFGIKNVVRRQADDKRGATHMTNLSAHKESDPKGDVVRFLFHNFGADSQRNPEDAATGKVSPLSATVSETVYSTPEGKRAFENFYLNLQNQKRGDIAQSGVALSLAYFSAFLLELEQIQPGCVSLTGGDPALIYSKRRQRSENCVVKSASGASWVHLAKSARERMGPEAEDSAVRAQATQMARFIKRAAEVQLVNRMSDAEREKLDIDRMRTTANRARLTLQIENIARFVQNLDLRGPPRAPALAQLRMLLDRHGDLVPGLPKSCIESVIKADDRELMRLLKQYGLQPSFWSLRQAKSAEMKALCRGAAPLSHRETIYQGV